MSDVIQQVRVEAGPAHPVPVSAYDAWVKLVLGFDIPAVSGPAPAQASVAELAARLKTVQEEAMLHGEAPAFAGALRAAALAVKARDAGAPALVEALEQRITAVTAAKRKQEADAMAAAVKTRSGMGSVAFNKLRLKLHTAQSRFDGAIENLKVACLALLETPDFLDDPRTHDPATLQAIEQLDERTPEMGALVETLEDAIDSMAGALDPAARQQHADAALKAIATFSAALEAEPLLTEMEHTDAGAFPIHSEMIAVLDELSAALRA